MSCLRINDRPVHSLRWGPSSLLCPAGCGGGEVGGLCVYGWRAMALDWTFSAGLQLEMWGLISPIVWNLIVWSHCLKLWMVKTLSVTLWLYSRRGGGGKAKRKLNKSTTNRYFHTFSKIIQVAMGSIIIHWFEDISWLELRDNLKHKGSNYSSWHWRSKSGE